MKTQIRSDIWKIMKDSYKIAADEPQTFAQERMLNTLTEYAFALQIGTKTTTEPFVKIRDLDSSNFSKPVKRRGRPAGAKNRV